VDLVVGDALIQQPPHQVRALGARGTLEPLEQIVDVLLRVAVTLAHSVNVQRRRAMMLA
jgi:hypothetical protein